MEDAPVLHESEREKGWETESKKILENEFDLKPMDVEGIERVLGTTLHNSIDDIRTAEIDSQPKNRVFREAGITSLGKEDVVLEYSRGVQPGELASLLMRGKMLKLHQQMGDALPSDDGFERRTYEQFVLQLPREIIDGINVSVGEKEDLAYAWREYENAEERFEGELDGELPHYPGRKRLLTKKEVAKKKPVSPTLKSEYLTALHEYQKQREKVLSKLAAKRYNEVEAQVKLNELMFPDDDQYGNTMTFINSVEQNKLERR